MKTSLCLKDDESLPRIEEEGFPEGVNITEKYPNFWNSEMSKNGHPYRFVTDETENALDAYLANMVGVSQYQY